MECIVFQGQPDIGVKNNSLQAQIMKCWESSGRKRIKEMDNEDKISNYWLMEKNKCMVKIK